MRIVRLLQNIQKVFTYRRNYVRGEKAGAGTYYLDANDCKQWKWLGAQGGTK